MNVANLCSGNISIYFDRLLIGIRHNRGEQGKLITSGKRRNNYFQLFYELPSFYADKLRH